MDIQLTTIIYASLFAFSISVTLCPILIPYLTKLKFGQTIRPDGPKTHLKKSGVPTMGGLVIVFSLAVVSMFFIKGNTVVLPVLIVTIGFGIIGFADDYLKVVKKRSLGLRAYQKMTMQIIVTLIFSFFLHRQGHGTDIYVPFANTYLDLGTFFYPFIFFVIIGTDNGVNFTDGLDGLASGVTVLVAMFFLFVSIALDSALSPVIGAAAGAILGFLLFNSHPAKIFMGDTGSLALGGFVASVAIILKMELLIPIVGLIYMVQVISVMLQVGYFKLTKGKRIFKMAPIHHHFELSGWEETKIVAVFYIVTAIMCLVGFLGTNVF